jgi:sugar phosphate isomerase/epimerase
VSIHPRVAVNTLCLPGTTLADDCDWITGIGARRITVAPGKLEDAGWEAGIDLVRRSGLTVATVVNPAWFTLDDPDSWDAVREQAIRTVDAAAALGAESLYGVTGPPGRLTFEEAADAYRDAVRPVREHADAVGVRLAIEPTNPLRITINLCHSLRDTVEVAALAGVAVCLDLYGCFAEGHLAQTIADHVDALALVQISDFVHGTLDTPNRAVPGDGDLPLERVVGWLLDAGYTGAFDLELNGPRIEAEGPRAAAERGAHALSAILDRLGA